MSYVMFLKIQIGSCSLNSSWVQSYDYFCHRLSLFGGKSIKINTLSHRGSSKIIKNHQKSWKFIDFHWFFVIFGHFWWFLMRPMLLTWAAPTHVMHHPSSQIVPSHETIEAQAFRWCLGIKIIPVVIRWRPNEKFLIFMILPFFCYMKLWI